MRNNISLKFGYIDDKYFSSEAIANFLGLTIDEVDEIVAKVYVKFRNKLNEILDNSFEPKKMHLVFKNDKK